MGQVLHGSARTTAAIRRAIQGSEESLRQLARRYGISPTTVQKWRKRSSTTDLPMGPSDPHSTVLTPEDEAIIVAFRRHSLLPLDDCLLALQPTIQQLTCSSLHRCLQRHGRPPLRWVVCNTTVRDLRPGHGHLPRDMRAPQAPMASLP